MPRALDHIVVPCRDLDRAARDAAALGFTVGRRNRHDWGTENHIIQLDGAFIELVALARDAVAPGVDDPAFPFAGYLAGQGASRDPSGMIVLASADADADAARLRAAGLGSGQRLDFARDGLAPDGSTRRVAFSLAFASLDRLPDIGAFFCHHHYPERFWSAEAQRHANGLRAIDAIEIAAAQPRAGAEELAAFAESKTVELPDGGQALTLGGGTRIELLREPAGSAPRLRALRFRDHGGESRRIALAAFTGRAEPTAHDRG